MKRIKVALPALALLAAIVASAFTMPHSKRQSPAHKSGDYWLQQNKPGTVLWTSSSMPTGLGWTDVTDSVGMDGFLYSDEQWHCTLNSYSTCIIEGDNSGVVQYSYNGISVLF